MRTRARILSFRSSVTISLRVTASADNGARRRPWRVVSRPRTRSERKIAGKTDHGAALEKRIAADSLRELREQIERLPTLIEAQAAHEVWDVVRRPLAFVDERDERVPGRLGVGRDAFVTVAIVQDRIAGAVLGVTLRSWLMGHSCCESVE